MTQHVLPSVHQVDERTIDGPPRWAIHDFDNCLMRDLFAGGKLVGTLFCNDARTGEIQAAAHPSDRGNYQPVGFAAPFMP